MKATRLLLALAALVLVASAAHAAPYVRLSWDQCDPQVANKMWSGPAGPYSLVVSLIGEDVLNSGHDNWIYITPFTSIPDAWRFDDTGCQTGSQIAYSYATNKACPSFEGTGPLGLQFFIYDPSPLNPDIASCYVRVVNTYNEFLPDPATRYTLFQVTFDHTYSVEGPSDPGLTCGGVETPLNFNLVTEVLETVSGDLQKPAMQPGDGQVTWNYIPVAAKATTWGRVKGLYR